MGRRASPSFSLPAFETEPAGRSGGLGPGRVVAAHVDLMGSLAHGVGVVPGLHAQQHVHVDAERFLNPERHLRRGKGV